MVVQFNVCMYVRMYVYVYMYIHFFLIQFIYCNYWSAHMWLFDRSQHRTLKIQGVQFWVPWSRSRCTEVEGVQYVCVTLCVCARVNAAYVYSIVVLLCMRVYVCVCVCMHVVQHAC